MDSINPLKEGIEMNRKLRISGFQFFCTIVLFQISMTGLLPYAINVKQDAWISALIGLFLGCLLFLVYIKLFEIYPAIHFTNYVQQILGKFAGKLVIIAYIIYFIYMAARILREFEQLLVITLFESSSLISLGILMMFLIMYGLFKGFETIARTTEVIFFFIILIISIIVAFEFIAKIHHINNLRPVLENGWRPVITASIPIGITFPFGEMVTFLMIMPHLNKQQNALKIGIPALVFSGLILTFFTIINISILGISVLERTNYPLLVGVSYINIANFVQRLDSFIVIFMICGGFIKITIFFYCAVSGTAEIFNIRKTNDLIYPIGVIILICSILVARNQIESIKERIEIIPYILHIPLQIIIPICLLIIALIQRKFKEKLPLPLFNK
ncbi:endospore germination permease [Bacillus sp. EAC]|uniref:GerAB/ArcD/ProY family transporter n=1 Tax=Bacillus sp. EAC TaxID=1978338 RepID=UPI000B44BFBE|nr:endospore germination permease [Bacillus sp. EAC]